MRSIYHTTATSAEDLRKELISWLETQITTADASAAHSRLMRDINHHLSRRGAFSEARDFWSEIRIDEAEVKAP